MFDFKATRNKAMATFIATHDQVRNLRTFPTLPVRGKNILADTTTTRAAERKLNATGGTQQGHTPRFRAMAAAGAVFAADACVGRLCSMQLGGASRGLGLAGCRQKLVQRAWRVKKAARTVF